MMTSVKHVRRPEVAEQLLALDQQDTNIGVFWCFLMFFVHMTQTHILLNCPWLTMKIYEICHSVAHLLVSVAQHGIISSFHAVTVINSYKWKYNSSKLRLIYIIIQTHFIPLIAVVKGHNWEFPKSWLILK
jgi:hypothetical protein